MARTKIAPEGIERELARLGELSLEELKAYYEELTGSALPKFMRRTFTELVVGHALQCAVLGGHDKETRRRLDALTAEIVPTGAVKPRPKNKKLRAGTKLIREWQGRVHEIVVTREGYLYHGTVFGSLTEIARTITGTNWNGWVFFGIKKAAAKHSVREQGVPVWEVADG